MVGGSDVEWESDFCGIQRVLSRSLFESIGRLGSVCWWRLFGSHDRRSRDIGPLCGRDNSSGSRMDLGLLFRIHNRSRRRLDLGPSRDLSGWRLQGLGSVFVSRGTEDRSRHGLDGRSSSPLLQVVPASLLQVVVVLPLLKGTDVDRPKVRIGMALKLDRLS